MSRTQSVCSAKSDTLDAFLLFRQSRFAYVDKAGREHKSSGGTAFALRLMVKGDQAGMNTIQLQRTLLDAVDLPPDSTSHSRSRIFA
jgi:hypothetical protein